MELSVMGERYFNNSGHFLIDGSEACYDVPQESLEVDGEVIFTNYLPGITPVCTFDVKNYLATPFNVLNSFRFPDSFGGAGLGPFLSTTFLLCCAIFFVATSDSSTFIVDCLASNGRKNFHWSRRTFWACTTGLQATMIVSTQTEALLVLKPAIFICGLPMAILLCYLVQSIVLLCEAADKTNELTDDTDYVFPDQPVFSMPVYGGVFNLMEYLMSVGQVNTARVEKQMHRATNDQILEFFKGLVVPFVSLHQILSATYPQNPKTNALVAGCFGVCFVVGVSLALAAFFYPGFHGLAWTIMLMTGIQLAIIRSGFRSLHNLRSNSLADFTSSMFLWPQVLTQMQLHEVARMNKDKPKHEVNDVDDDDDNDNEESEDTMQVKC